MSRAPMSDALTPPIRGLILDMDGVLWKDTAPIGDLARVFAKVRTLGLQVVLATNNATKSVEEYIKKLAGFGVALEPWQIVTSSQGVVATLLKEFPEKGKVFVVGEGGLIRTLSEAGFPAITDPADASPVVAVIGGLDHGLNYAKLQRAMTHIRSGARFYGTNPDPTFPTPDGLVPGAGAIIAAMKASVGIDPVIIGKPAPFMFRLSAERMRLDLSDILVVGDRLETDIAGGQAIGARTALVLSGVSTQEQADQWSPRPDLVAPDLGRLLGV